MVPRQRKTLPKVKRIHKFKERVLNYIQDHEYFNAATFILSGSLYKAVDEFGSLLHYAAKFNNERTTRLLFELGTDINGPGKDGKTPLMIAVAYKRATIVDVLFEYGADVDIVDDNGRSALQMVFKSTNISFKIAKSFLRRVQSQTPNTEELVDRLRAAGCKLYHAAILGNREVLKCMLNRGMNIDSRGCLKRTALHAAVLSNKLDLAEWLINEGADVNAQDKDGYVALFFAVGNTNKDMLLLLLERGADPNIVTERDGLTALAFILIVAPDPNAPKERSEECTEILLQHGADPQIRTKIPNEKNHSLFYWARATKSANKIEAFVAHLAMLEMMGTTIEPAMIAEINAHAPSKEYYRACRQYLKNEIYQSLTFIDFLRETDRNIKICQTYLSILDHKPELKKKYRYYYNTLQRCVSNTLKTSQIQNGTFSNDKRTKN